MIAKRKTKLLFASAALWMASNMAQAETIACTGSGYDISANLSGAVGCLILSPLDGNGNDSVSPPESSYTVNQNSFFGSNNWSFDGKYDAIVGSDSASLFDFTGDGQSGTYEFVGNGGSYDRLMFVLKDGSGTNLVAYLLPESVGSGTYETPFTKPPFTFNGEESHDISHISVYYIEGEGGGPGTGIPEPGSAAILGLGLLGMGLVSVRRKRQQP